MSFMGYSTESSECVSHSVDKTVVMREFNKNFFQFLEEILFVFPDNEEIQVAQNSFETIKRANPSAIIKAWYKFVYIPYNSQLEQGDLDYFLQKDYSEDLENLKNSNRVMQVIDALRTPLSGMSPSNKQTSVEYLKTLCKLSALYPR